MPDYEDLLEALKPQQTAKPAGPTWPPSMDSVIQALSRTDPGFEYTGVPDFSFRAGFSRRDTENERERYLTEMVGLSGWTKDKYGAWAITPEGMRKIGMTPSEKPVTIEDSGVTRYDIADVAGDLPSVLGGVLGGALGPAGIIPGMIAAGGGTAAGKAAGEGIEHLRGENVQPFGDVASDVGVEGALGAAGEGVYRGALAPIGRKLMAPQASRVTPEARRMLAESRAMGAQPNVQQVTKAPILGRAQSMMNRILGDPLQAKNQRALTKEIDAIKQAAGRPSRGRRSLGETIAGDIRNARKALSRWSQGAYGEIDDIAQGAPVINTRVLKAQAAEVLESLPKTAEGAPVLTSPETVQAVKSIVDLPDGVTISQMQAMSSRLYDMIDDTTLVPGISGHQSRLLYKASREALFDVAEEAPQEIPVMLKEANRHYAKQIKQFDDALVNRIVRDPKYAGAIEPERIVDATFRRGESAKLQRIMRLLPDGTKSKLRRAAVEDILRDAVSRTDDPLVGVFTGKNLLNSLDKYGRESLNAMFGADMTGRLYRFGNVSQFVNQKMAQSGGLVAAHIALHPWRNFGRLVGLNIMSKVMNSPKGLKWLTEGLEAPNTRHGAAALSRLTTQVMALTEQATQSEQHLAPMR